MLRQLCNKNGDCEMHILYTVTGKKTRLWDVKFDKNFARLWFFWKTNSPSLHADQLSLNFHLLSILFLSVLDIIQLISIENDWLQSNFIEYVYQNYCFVISWKRRVLIEAFPYWIFNEITAWPWILYASKAFLNSFIILTGSLYTGPENIQQA